MDLFDAAAGLKNEGPLAARMRPRNLDEYIGQDHIVGRGRLLRRAIAADQLTSVIFYGPPGTGKTTLAKVIANHTKSIFVSLNAVLTGVQNIRDAIAKAEEQRKLYNRRTILFVDEVHRWNKSQQDALLPWVENGTIILVGATTENPFFEVNKALVSRSRVFQLNPLTKDDLAKAALAALQDKERGYGRWKLSFEAGALEHLIETANGDARSLLNALELAVETTPERWAPQEIPCVPPEGSSIYISCETAEESIQQKVVLYDKDGDYHYDIISAFIKSLRGRDPDGAMYWMARMLAAGEDPHFIFRRMLISACEDTGLADPQALGIVESCAAAFDRIGLPEGRFMLTQAALYLATCPKSNSTLCFFDALKVVAEEDAEVPNHLKDGSRDSESFGHGKDYMYPHAYRDHWVTQQYLPDSLRGRVFYNPSNQGYERKIQNEVLNRRELQITVLLEQKNRQRHQNESADTDALLSLRDEAINLAELQRHHRCLVMGADDGFFLWELWRKTPEGYTAGLCRSARNMAVLAQYGTVLGLPQKNPFFKTSPVLFEKPSLFLNLEDAGDVFFDRIFYRNPITTKESIKLLTNEITSLRPFLTAETKIIIVQKLPAAAQGLAALLLPLYENSEKKDDSPQNKKTALLQEVAAAEKAFYADTKNPLFNWTIEILEKELQAVWQNILPKPSNTETTEIGVESIQKNIQEQRRLSSEEIDRWFNENASYGSFLTKTLGKEKTQLFRRLLETTAEKTIFNWLSAFVFFLL